MNTYAVIGDPVEHSLSPAIHNFLIKYYDIKQTSYIPVKIPKDNIALLKDIWSVLNLQGANVTMPHKQNIMTCLSRISDDAKLYNSVNTVVRTDDGLSGYNTDARGFIAPLNELGFDLKKSNVLMLGAGGVAGTLAISLLNAGINNITIAARNKNAASDLQQSVTSALNNNNVSVCPLEGELLTKSLKNCDLLINTTPLGMTGISDNFTDLSFLDLLQTNALVYDLIYSPMKTDLLIRAEKKGQTILNGLPMLIWQALFAFEYFFKLSPSVTEKKMVETFILDEVLSGINR